MSDPIEMILSLKDPKELAPVLEDLLDYGALLPRVSKIEILDISSLVNRLVLFLQEKGLYPTSDLLGFLFDVGIPRQLREAVEEEIKSEICGHVLSRAHDRNLILPLDIRSEIIGQFMNGKRRALPTLIAAAMEKGFLLDPKEKENLEGFRVTSDLIDQAARELEESKKQADKFVSNLQKIAEHASRQPDGVWPKGD